MQFIDTHCHIHESNYPLLVDDVLKRAAEAGVDKMICVGTGVHSSTAALELASKHENLFASIGVHPHDTHDGWSEISKLAEAPHLTAVGEIGLDYYYENSPRDIQIKALEGQMQIALDHDLPIIFHVRDASSAERSYSAFDDFWAIFDNFRNVRGVLHSFTDTQTNLDKAFERGLFVGINGISTFTKDSEQQKMFAGVPLEKMILETDAPFLAPLTHRGAINEPAYIRDIAEHHAKLRGVNIDEVAAATTANAEQLFDLNNYKTPPMY